MCPEQALVPGHHVHGTHGGLRRQIMETKPSLYLQICSLGDKQLYSSHIDTRSSKQLVYGDGNISFAGTVLTFVIKSCQMIKMFSLQ